MKKILLTIFAFILILTSVFMAACYNDSSETILIEDHNLEVVSSFSNKLTVFNSIISPIINEAITRSDDGEPSLTEEEMNIVINETDKLVLDSNTMFEAIGIDEDEINEMFTEDYRYGIVIAAVAYLALTLDDNNTSTRSEASTYASCAASAIGINMFDGLTSGSLSAAAKVLLKNAAKRICTPVAVCWAAAEFIGCVGISNLF